MKLLTAAESRDLDRLSTADYGIASYALMTRAGEAITLALARRWSGALATGVVVVAGKGNNGGDGLVAARRLMRSRVPVRVVLLASAAALKGDAARACSEYLADGGAIREVRTAADLEGVFNEPAGAIVDAIFGTGLNAPVSGTALLAINEINRIAAPVMAVDIASGVNADTGAIMSVAVEADATVTFGLAKFGHVSYPGAEKCGELEVVDIGFAPAAIERLAPSGRFLEPVDVQPLIRKRPANSHKGSYGHPLIVAGSVGKAGAAILASRAALRTGAGLVTTAAPEPIAGIVAASQAELMTEPVPHRAGRFHSRRALSILEKLTEGKSSLVAGPGIGVSRDTIKLVKFLVRNCTRADMPLLLDADGLNALALAGVELLHEARGPVLLTPHPGEMARLLATTNAAVNADRISAACKLAERSRATVLLKGARSIIASAGGALAVNSTGNAGMATPGMGDALSGMVGALLGQGAAPMDALTLGVFLHGYTADRIAQRRAPVGYLAGDLIDELPEAMATLAAWKN